MREELKLNNQLCFRLYKASRNMTRVYQPLLEKYNLTYPQYIIMLVLFEREVIDFKELSEIVDLKTGTLTPIITKLEQIGYVSKEKNEDDSRKINVRITETGIKLKSSIIDVPLQLGSQLELSMEEYKTLVNELDNLIQKMKKEIENE